MRREKGRKEGRGNKGKGNTDDMGGRTQLMWSLRWRIVGTRRKGRERGRLQSCSCCLPYGDDDTLLSGQRNVSP